MIHNCCNYTLYKVGCPIEIHHSFPYLKKEEILFQVIYLLEERKSSFYFVYIVICFFTRPASGTTMMPANTTCITFPGMDPSGCIQLP